MAPLTRAYVPEVIMTTCIYGCVRARDVFIHSVRARGKFIGAFDFNDAKAASGEEGIYRDTGVFPSGDATAVSWRTRRPLVGLGMEPLTKLVNVCI